MSGRERELSPGTLLDGRYRVIATLAQGGMGAVYDALDERLDRPVAMKVLRRELAEEHEARRRFEREARLVAKLGHPNVAQVLDFGYATDGSSFLIMERVPGETLAKLLERERRVESLRAAHIVQQGLDGLSAAHALGIVHRDIKPGNVMIFRVGASTRDTVKLLDFGVASFVPTQTYTRLTSTGMIVGTPAYMAPEQARGEPVDERTDLYAMGVLLYCLLAGRRPFQGDMGAMLEGVLFSEPPSLAFHAPDAPPMLIDIVTRAMRKQPAERFASAEEMSRALAALLPERTSMPGVAPRHAGPSSPRHSRLPIAPHLAPHVAPPLSGRASTPTRPPTPTLSLGSDPLPLPRSSFHALSPPSQVIRAPVPSPPSVASTPAERLRATLVTHRRSLGGFAFGVVAVSSVLGVALVVLLAGGAGVFWWWTTDQASPPLGVASPGAPIARAQPGSSQTTGQGQPGLGASSSGSLGGSGDAACGRAVACCQALSRIGVISPSACSMYTSSYMPASTCHEVLASYATVLRSQGADDRECDDPDARGLVGLGSESPGQVVSVTGASSPAAVSVTGGGPVHGGSNSPSCRGWFPTQPQLRVDVGAGVSEVEIAVESGRDTTLLVRGPSGSILCDDDSGGGLNPMIRVSPRAGEQYAVFVGVYSTGTAFATAHVTGRR